MRQAGLRGAECNPCRLESLCCDGKQNKVLKPVFVGKEEVLNTFWWLF